MVNQKFYVVYILEFKMYLSNYLNIYIEYLFMEVKTYDEWKGNKWEKVYFECCPQIKTVIFMNENIIYIISCVEIRLKVPL